MSSPIKSAAAAAAEQSTAPGINGSVALTHTNGNQTAQQSTAVAQAPLTNAAAPVAQSMAANPTPLDAKRSQKNNSGSHSSSNGGSLSSSTPGGTAAAVGELAQPIVAKMRRLIDAKKPFYSFEYFPPKVSLEYQMLQHINAKHRIGIVHRRLTRCHLALRLFTVLLWSD